MSSEADEIASLVLKQFDRLPGKRKPPVRDNGTHEWVPLSGIVARGTNGKATCLALATGMKCLPASRLSLANGVAVHDWHAEILAIRAFNQFVLEECRNIALHSRASNFLRLRTAEEIAAADKSAFHGQPFSWKDGVTLHMYCSEAPCGDASMELTMAAQEDASPWDVPAPPSTSAGSGNGSEPPALLGRGYFSQLGVVRRKPARGDAPPTLSKSCSDKLALKQCTSLLSSLTSLLVCPDGVYLRTLILPESQYSETGCRRSFSADEDQGGRMHPVAGKEWRGGYAFRPFEVQTTRREFAYSKRSVAARADRTAASNLAVAWARNGLEESLIGGVLQGRKQFDLRGATPVSRRKMWSLATEVAAVVGMSCVAIQKLLQSSTYKSVKDGELLSARRQAKSEARASALAGWVRNTDDDEFRLE